MNTGWRMLRPSMLLGLTCLCLGCGDSPAASVKVLRVYNWSNYIAPKTIAAFEAETGIDVIYDVFDSNEVLEAKLLSGASGYDLVVPSSSFLGRQIIAGVFQKLDRSKLTNYGNLDEKLLVFLETYDPGNEHSVPYVWGTTGIGYNVEKVQARLGPAAPLDSLDLLFDPKYISKLSDCGVAFLDAPQEVIPTALHYLGLDPNTFDTKLIRNDAQDLLMTIRPYITYFHSSRFINDLANGDICAAFAFSGDILQAKARAEEAANGVNIAYVIPREGAGMWFDMLAIPAGAKNAGHAHQFIDYLLRPEVIAAISNEIHCANPNKASFWLIDAEIAENQSIYPPDEVIRTLFTFAVTPPKVDRAYNRVFTRVKTSR